MSLIDKTAQLIDAKRDLARAAIATAPRERRAESDAAAPTRPTTAARSSASPTSPSAASETAAPAASADFALDFGRLRQLGFITPNTRRSRTSEEFRLIKRRLMQRMSLRHAKNRERAPGLRGEPLRAGPSVGRDVGPSDRGREHVVLVTSARPGEGKSFFAANLALSIALDEGLNVLLVDADVLRPKLSGILGVPARRPGLTDLLVDQEADLADFLIRERRVPLSFLGAGGSVASATDLFASERMQRLVAEIADRYTDRIVIFDSPPLLASTEPVVLAQHAGQVVLMIDAERTSRSAVDSALDLLDADDKVNLVLNKVAMKNRLEQFGSYYDSYDADR